MWRVLFQCLLYVEITYLGVLLLYNNYEQIVEEGIAGYWTEISVTFILLQ